MSQQNAFFQNSGQSAASDLSADDIFDLEFLDHQTLGRKELRTEILKLFRMQLEQHGEALAKIDIADNLRVRFHTIKGAAHGVGAKKLAYAAGAAEKTVLAGAEILPADMQHLRLIIAQTIAKIDRLIGAE